MANVAGRAELLSAALSLSAFLCFTAACPESGGGGGAKRRRRATAAAPLCFVLGTLAKETGFTVLGAVWAYDLLHNGALLRRLHAACCCCGCGSLDQQQPAPASSEGRETHISAPGAGGGCGDTGGDDDDSGRVSPACRDGTAFWRAVVSRHVPLLLCAAGYLVSRRSLSHRFSPAISARDNHLALEQEWTTRVLSYISLHGRYAGLLLYPTVRRSCDPHRTTHRT